MRNKTNRFKMMGTVMCIFCLLLTFAACGSGSSGNGSILSKSPTDGMWVEEDATNEAVTMAIEGEYGYIHFSTSEFMCLVDEEAKTITVKKYSWDDSDVIYTFDFVNNKMMMSTDNDKAYRDTLVFVEDASAEQFDTKGIDGEWDAICGLDISASFEGEKGFISYSVEKAYSQDFSCSIDKTNETVTVDGFSWDDSKIEFSYKIINGRLLLYTDDTNAYTSALAMEPTKEDAKKGGGDVEEATDVEDSTDVEEESSLEGWKQLSRDYYVVGEDIEAGIYDLGPVEDDDSFSVIIFDNMDYFEQSPYSTSEKEAKDDFYKHNRTVYGDEIEKGISLKKGNVLYVDYQGVLYNKQ